MALRGAVLLAVGAAPGVAAGQPVARADEAELERVRALIEVARPNRALTHLFVFEAGDTTLALFTDVFDGEPAPLPDCNPDVVMPGAPDCPDALPPVEGEGPRVIGIARVARGELRPVVEREFRGVRFDWELEDVDGDGAAELTVRMELYERYGENRQRLWVAGSTGADGPGLRADIELVGGPRGGDCEPAGFRAVAGPSFVRTGRGRAIVVEYERLTPTRNCQGTPGTGNYFCECEPERRTVTFSMGTDGRFLPPSWDRRWGPF